MELREIFECELRLIEEKKGLPKYALAKLVYDFAEGDIKNLNARTYLEPLLQREISKKNEEIRTGGILGQLDHPIDGNTKLGKAMHILSNLSYDKTSKLASAESLILDTQSGRDFLTILKTGAKLGASMRGWGTTSDRGIVQDNWKLSSIDFVLNPSYGDIAKIDQSNLIESYDPETKKVEKVKKTKVKIDEKNIELALKICYDAEVAEYGYGEGFEQYKRKKLTFITCEWLVQNYPDRFKNIEEALKYLGVGELAGKYSAEKEQRTKPYTSGEVYAEAVAAGIHPQEMADKLNENMKIGLSLSAAGITERECSLMCELRDAGSLDVPLELLEKVRKIEQMQRIFKPSLSGEQKKAEDLKKMRQEKEARRQRIIYEVNRDVMAAGGTSPEIAKAMVRKALKEENLLEE